MTASGNYDLGATIIVLIVFIIIFLLSNRNKNS